MKTLVDKVKSGARTLAFGAAIGLASLAYSPKAEATLVPVRMMNFYDIVDVLGDSLVPTKSVGMLPGTSLKVRDPITFEDSIVEAGSHWHMGFVSSDGKIVGYAENRSSFYPGRMSGQYLETIGEGKRPKDVWTVEDVGKDGIADWYPSIRMLVFDGALNSNPSYLDDNFYFSKDLLIDGVQGGVDRLPMLVTSGSIYLPEMIVNPIPEPATIGLLGLGAGALALRRKRKYVESKVVD